MIIDNLHTSQCEYGNMDGRLARAFAWLRANDLKAIQPGQVIPIEDHRISAQIQSYLTIRPSEGSFETHRSFIDIQIMVRGAEVMYWTPAANLTKIKTPYNYENDIVFFEEPELSIPFRVADGDFAIFFPSDGHKPKCLISYPAEVGKIVVKVAV
jgi:YhcH/YjgK/YiaL family protein